MKSKVARALTTAAGVTLFAAPVAGAASPYDHIAGVSNDCAYAWNGGAAASSSTPSYYWFYVKDGLSDGYTVHGNYSNAKGTGSLDNNSGGGTTTNKWTGARITSVQACANHTIFPDECSAWK